MLLPMTGIHKVLDHGVFAWGNSRNTEYLVNFFDSLTSQHRISISVKSYHLISQPLTEFAQRSM